MFFLISVSGFFGYIQFSFHLFMDPTDIYGEYPMSLFKVPALRDHQVLEEIVLMR